MKRIINSITLVMLTGMLAYAQDYDMPRMEQMQERIEAQKVAFITNKLELTADESAAFWPLYNEYQAKERAIRDKMKPGDKRIEDMTEAEANEVLDNLFKGEEEVIDLKREYYGKMKKIISTKRLIRLQQIERDFNLEILNRLRQMRGGGGPNAPDHPMRNKN